MLDDAQLLRRYADEKSQAAFAELVQRHLDLVYSAALRQVDGDVHRAKDIAQQVFTMLAQKAHALVRHPSLTGWLYVAARHCATRARRGERRRWAREREAVSMSEPVADIPLEWERARPVLDAAMSELGDTDREAVLLRYFARRPFAQIGAALNVSEDGARRRVERALEKLRAKLARRGVTSSAVALAAVLEGNAVLAAPTELMASVTGTAVTASGGGGTSVMFMNMSKLQIALGVAAVVGAGIFFSQLKATADLRGELAQRRDETQRAERLRGENRRLAATAATVAPAAGESPEPTLVRKATPVSSTAVAARRVPDPAGLAIVNLPDADVPLVLRTYEGHSGQRVVRDAEVDRVLTPVTIKAGPLPRYEMLELIRRALLAQAHIQIETAADGTTQARLVR